MNDSFAVISHEPDQCRVPLVNNFGESRRTRTREDVTNTVVKPLDT